MPGNIVCTRAAILRFPMLNILPDAIQFATLIVMLRTWASYSHTPVWRTHVLRCSLRVGSQCKHAPCIDFNTQSGKRVHVLPARTDSHRTAEPTHVLQCSLHVGDQCKRCLLYTSCRVIKNIKRCVG